MASNTPVTVDDPNVAHGGDGHHGDAEEHMLVGHDGQLHPSNLRFYFVSSEQQFEASKLGMWLFLATEILLFGGMFVAYGIFRIQYPELYEQASMQLDTVLGALNTLVLLLSSLTMAWAIRAAQMDNRKLLIQMLSATMLLATGFLVVKYFEYGHKFDIGIYPGINFELDEGTQSVADLTGAVPLAPAFERPTGEAAADEAQIVDQEVVEADAGPMAAGDAELSGADQAGSGVPQEEPVAEVAAGANETGDGEDVPQEAVEAAVAGSEAMAGVPGQEDPGELAQTGPVATEHGDDSHADDHGREGEIFSNRRAGIFFAIYYMMTGIHALHIIIGIIAIGFLTFFAARGKYSSVYYTPVENVGLYWHIVDIIWIFVFPLMYLI